METFRADEFMGKTGSNPFVQDSYCKSAQGILRGLHYQQTQTQGKLVRVISGAVFNVAVDILAKRQPLYKTKLEENANRWSGSPRNWQPAGNVLLNPNINEELI
ncbi:MAG: dTDP-4-dehydrorhamnose 3,5-epimerase-like enzyme [Francisellaceae bacterium]|jgi:dTDP-4-dehydrorhamnose 3,5-epimerase-like enzyme